MKKLFFIYLLLLIFTAAGTNNISAQTKSDKLLIYNGLQLKMGVSTNINGWEHPDPYLTSAYQNPQASNYGVDLDIEMLYQKYYQTNIQTGVWGGTYRFDYYIKNSEGQVIGSKELANNFGMIRVSITERLKYQYRKLCLFIFAGPRADFRFTKTENYDPDFQKIFSKKSTFGLSTGAGLDFSFGHFVTSANFYYNPDITDLYSSDYGKVRNSEMGIAIGLGVRKMIYK